MVPPPVSCSPRASAAAALLSASLSLASSSLSLLLSAWFSWISAKLSSLPGWRFPCFIALQTAAATSLSSVVELSGSLD